MRIYLSRSFTAKKYKMAYKMAAGVQDGRQSRTKIYLFYNNRKKRFHYG